MPAPQAALGELGAVSVDRQGRLIMVEWPWKGSSARVVRLEQDGTLKELWRHKSRIAAAFEVPGGKVWAFQPDPTVDIFSPDKRFLLYELQPGAEPKLLKTFDGADGKRALPLWLIGHDDAGRIHYYRNVFDPATMTFTDHTADVVDQFGNQFRYAHDGTAGRAEVTPIDGKPPWTLGPWLPTMWYSGAAIAPDGTAWVYSDKALWRRDGAAFTHVAGAAGGASTPGGTFAAADLPLQKPQSAIETADGLYIVDTTKKEVYLVKDGVGRLFAGGAKITSGTEEKGRGDGGPAVDAGLMGPAGITADAAGNVYVTEKYFLTSGVRKIARDGTISTYLTIDGQIDDILMGPDDSLYMTVSQTIPLDGGRRLLVYRVYKVPPGGGTPVDIENGSGGNATKAIAFGPDGTLYVAQYRQLRRWTAGGLVLVKQDEELFTGYARAIAVDARGRVYVAQMSPPLVTRYDPATDTKVIVAGPGGTSFAGDGVDDSLNWVTDVSLTPDGSLLIVDQNHQQVKRIPAAELP